MNRAYTIRRNNILDAIRKAGLFCDMGKDLPRDESAGECELDVLTGNWEQSWGDPRPGEMGHTIRLTVRVTVSGVANRIQVKCPECGTWMRFSALQQHADTPACRRAKDKELDAGYARLAAGGN